MADDSKSIASSAYSGDSKSEQTATIATRIEKTSANQRVQSNFWTEHPQRPRRNGKRTKPRATRRPELRNRQKYAYWCAC